MSGKLWLEYDGDNYHDIIHGHNAYINSARRKRHETSIALAIPDHLVRIKFIRGDQGGCQYVYAKSIGDDLVKNGKAVYAENQMESEPFMVIEVIAAINASRKRDGFPPIRELRTHDREPGEEG